MLYLIAACAAYGQVFRGIHFTVQSPLPFPQTPCLLVRPTAEMDLDGMDSFPAESRNGTESDIPGPGRLLGKIYAKLGRKLETVLNLAARSTGRGPAPTANEIEQLARTLKYPDYHLCCRTPSKPK